MVEFVLWGNPPGHDSTYGKALLCSGLETRAAAERARARLERDYGVKEITIQEISGTKPAFGRESLA
jgi:hypothetical protein